MTYTRKSETHESSNGNLVLLQTPHAIISIEFHHFCFNENVDRHDTYCA
jgi:hypothetical protein